MKRKKSKAQFRVVPVTDSARHEASCSICRHRERQGIERSFIAWESASKIAREYKVNVHALYRHVKALNLFPQRNRNIRWALRWIIEKGMTLRRVTPAVVVQAIAVFARINSRGQLIERRETVNLNELFDRMSNSELDAYARDGSLPEWFTRTVGVTTGEVE